MYLNILKHQITDLLLHLILLMKQFLKNKPPVLTLHIQDNNQNNQNKNPQNKKPLLIFFKILILLKNNHYTHRYHKSQICNNQILLKQIQFTIHQYFLKKQYNTRSFTITDDSNLIIIPTHNITQNEFTNQNQDNTSNTNPDNTSILSTSNTNITQPSQTQILSPRNYNPPSVPPQFSTQINLMTPLNKAHQIHPTLHKTIIQYIFKHQLHHYLLRYTLRLILQLKPTQYKLHKLP